MVSTYRNGLRKETYLVNPSLHVDLFEHIRPITLFAAISTAKVIYLIPVRLPGSRSGETAASPIPTIRGSSSANPLVVTCKLLESHYRF